ncbi:Bifunctional inhibitor/plant lipid transfer protein/seed storage helical domain [Dillenia turbinata]|uniref:Bifunctional inhibitor/plant lipid transfer protein/seed storage helical domain n=1 Tax=Dillenia turbinata TaxID=194707 RepID=A0AAN8Z6J9_9MAGN
MASNESMIFGFLLVILMAMVGFGGSALTDECNSEFTKVGSCLSYATAKTATPTVDCCKAVSSIKDDKPVCLCYIIQQTHNGSQEIKSLGLQESRLLQLPSACKLANASLSDCPKLLNLSPSDPTYSIFTNTTAASETSTPSTVSGTSTAAADSSSGSRLGTQFGALIATCMVIIFQAFPACYFGHSI